jgi:NAD(P)-dependent dehydrogenase (short-subunit alcohol dehydrogenase family)
MSCSFAGRVVVVTAGSTDAAIALAAEGATVVVADTDAHAAGALAARIAAIGGRAAVFTGDLASADARAALAELLDELFGERASTKRSRG